MGLLVGSSIRLISPITHTANEEPVRIQYKCLVPIYVFPEIKLLFPKQNYYVLSSSSYSHTSVRNLYISRIGLPILLQGNMWTDAGYINRSHTHKCGNWDWTAQIPEKEYINGIFQAVHNTFLMYKSGCV
jgi:hypothetical protein